MQNQKALAAVAASMLVFATNVVAGDLLWLSDTSNMLGTVDVETGSVSLVGNTGVFLSDIAFSPSGDLYGISFSNLYSVNKVTAAITLIGAHGMTSSPNALVFDSDGTLYAAGSSLYTLNTATGASSLVGAIGFQSSGDLAFVNSKLYLSATGGDRLVEVNPNTGQGSLIGSIGFPNVYGLATPDNVSLFGLSGNSVIAIDATSGAGSFLADFSPSGTLGIAAGSAFFSEATPPIPEPSTSALFVVGVSAILACARRRTTA